MSSSFWLLGVESPDFSQAEKERTACKAGQIHKMTTIFTHNDNIGPKAIQMIYYLNFLNRTILSENNCHCVNLLSFASSSFFLSMIKIT